ncbi:MAG: sulfatase-like hydrolase/transferase [Acidobacteria bacterium]|nr:sulfatase-like hydrolase/transferase [Acidobacteriota bacterium]
MSYFSDRVCPSGRREGRCVRRSGSGSFSWLVLLGLALAILASTASAALARPDRKTKRQRTNILLILADNLGYGDLGCYGNKTALTPNVDRLAAEGVRCTNFYIASPSCSPSRGAILTGRHPERNGLNHQLRPNENLRGEGLPRSERILPQYLKPLGYATGAFGKWNLGFAPGSRPTDRGFDEFLGHMSGNIHYFKHLYHRQNDLRSGTEPTDRRGKYSTDLFADAAIDFVRRHKDQPWFAYLPFNAVHFVGANNVEPGERVEWQVPAKYLAVYGCPPDVADQKKRFLATVTALDDAIGRVLQVVDELSLREQTLVLFLSDNGAFMLPGRGLEVQSNRPLRDGGVTTYEGGIRVPAIVRWPKRIKGHSLCNEILSSLDLLPMAITAAGGKLPENSVLDGLDPTSTLAGQARSPQRELHWLWNQGRNQQWRAMREGSFKLVRRASDDPWELYDLSTDLAEAKDLSREQPLIVKRLVDRFERWHESVKNDPLRGRRVSE